MQEYINENVSLFYAKDKYENIIYINEITDANKDIEFVCPICGEVVKPRAIHSDKISQHFYHVNASDHSSETIMHWWYKNAYMIQGDVFKVKHNGVVKNYICDSIEIEKSFNTSFGTYKPDVVVNTACGKQIFFEYNYKSKKNVCDYEEKWIELGNDVVEISIKDLLNASIRTFPCIFIDGVVVGKSRSERYGVIEKHIVTNKITEVSRIKYLNGFLRDVYRYNKGIIDIDDLSIIIDNMNDVDKLFIPKMLGKLKCHNVLSDYSDNKLRYAKNILNEILIKKQLPINEYQWIVTSRYSQKWTKSRGCRFNNTIIIMMYSYSKMYNYNRCQYNECPTGFEVLFVNDDSIRAKIERSAENEIERMKNIKKDSFEKYLREKRYKYDRLILNYINQLNTQDYNVSSTEICHSRFPSIRENFDVLNTINGYKGVGRYKEIERIVFDKCNVLNDYYEAKIEHYQCIERLSDNVQALQHKCKLLFGFDINISLPDTANRWRIDNEVELRNKYGELIYNIELEYFQRDMSEVDYVFDLIHEKFNKLNNIKYLKWYVANFEIGKVVECKDVIKITFFSKLNRVNCYVEIYESLFVLNYAGKTMTANINNFFEVIELLNYISEKLY